MMLLRSPNSDVLHVGQFRGDGTWTSICPTLDEVQHVAGTGWVNKPPTWSRRRPLSIVLASTYNKPAGRVCAKCLAKMRGDLANIEALAARSTPSSFGDRR